MAQRADVSGGHRHATQSPVPSLTNEASRSSSASSSVNSMSPDTLATTTPRDLLPRFESAAASDACARNHQHGSRAAAPMKGAGAGSGAALPEEAHSDRQRKRRRDSDLTETTHSDNGAEEPRCAKRRVKCAAGEESARCVRRRHLTGDADFVRLFGLSDLYNEYVRPYAGPEQQPRRPLPALATAYLSDVKVADPLPQQQQPSPDLLGLVMAPPKNNLDRLDLLSSASIRAAFRVGADPARRSKAAARAAPEDAERSRHHKRPRVALKMSGDSRLSTPRPASTTTAAHADSQRASAKHDGDYDSERRRHPHHSQRPQSHHRQQQQQQQQPSPPKAY